MQDWNINSEERLTLTSVSARFFLVIILMGGIFFAACRKKEFPVKNQLPEEGDYVYVKGLFNGEYKEIKMTSPDYEMELSCGMDSLSVFEYKSGLLPVSCYSCYQIQFYFRDPIPSYSGEPGHFSSLIVPQTQLDFMDYQHLHIHDTNYVLNFHGYSNKPQVNYNFVFGDGSMSYAANPSHKYSTAKKYNVRLFVHDPSEQTQTFNEQIIDLQHFKKSFYYYVRLDSVKQNQQLAFFCAKSIFPPANVNEKYYWNFGQGFMPGGNFAVVSFIPNVLKHISLKVVRGLDTCVSHYQLVVPAFSSTMNLPLTSNFYVKSYTEQIQTGLNFFLKKCNIMIKTPSGKIYQSKYAGSGNKNFSVVILHAAAVTSPVSGYSAHKVRFTFNSNLVNESDNKDTLNIRNAEAQLIFIHK